MSEADKDHADQQQPDMACALQSQNLAESCREDYRWNSVDIENMHAQMSAMEHSGADLSPSRDSQSSSEVTAERDYKLLSVDSVNEAAAVLEASALSY